MTPSISVACGFLGGTILSAKGGYRVLQHPRPDRIFNRIADARWFLAISWCDRCPDPAGILTHDGQLSFQNQAVLTAGETDFIPLAQRQQIFEISRTLAPGESALYTIEKSSDRPGTQISGESLSDRLTSSHQMSSYQSPNYQSPSYQSPSYQSPSHQINIQGIEIDPRYGKVALVKAVGMGPLPQRSPF
ncbi:MAG: hypothetical protein AAF651_07740 [Cyanobacteria bacterium P01_C01_bin.73]